MLGKNSKEREVATPNVNTGGSGGRDGSVIGKGMAVSGACETDGHLRVDGKVSGDVRAQGLELTASGAIEGDVGTPRAAKGAQPFVIGGRVTGTVTAAHVEVRASGVVLGGIVAEEASIQGRVEGGIVVKRRLALADTAVVEGDVRAHRLSLQEGGQVNGTIYMGENAVTGSEDSRPERIAEKPRDRDEKRDGVLVGAGAA